MFRITAGKGFHITFENGWTVSVQWGRRNYIAGHSQHLPTNPDQSPNAEIAAWDKDNKWIRFPDGYTVAGYQTPEQVAAFIAKVAKKKGE